MSVQLKKLDQQTMVITGASSGIGLATAKMAAQRGAQVVLVSRDETDLRQAVEEIREAGGEASYAVADVSDMDEVQRVADDVIRAYGGFDTWVNNAAVSIYGRLEEVELEDARRLFDVNYWGMVHGSLVAIPHLRRRGGALINIGSVVSDRAIPLQGQYSASKHAIKGFTDALRMELEEEGAPISVTLVKPSSIDTPFTVHAKNLMDVEPSLPPPVYAPEVVAEAILECAETPTRDISVGAGGRMLAAMGHVAPRLTDRYMEASLFDQQRTDEPVHAGRRDALYEPMSYDSEERGTYSGHVMKSSMYTSAVLHPRITTVAITVLGAGLAWALGSEFFRGGDRE